MQNKPDDRSDNVEKIQCNIDHTINNIRCAEDTIKKTSNESTKENLLEKNERRKEALEGLRSEIKDEAHAKHNE